MFRLLCVACCVSCFASPAGAIVIVQEGDEYDELVVSDPEFLMAGGSVNRLMRSPVSLGLPCRHSSSVAHRRR